MSPRYHFVADDAFPLSTRMSKPFPRKSKLTSAQKVHNYRLSRCRRTVENSFGLLSNKFRVLRAPIMLSLENATSVVKAVVSLHNFLLAEDGSAYMQPDLEDDDHGIIPGEWETCQEKTNLLDIDRLAGNRSGTSEARRQRDAVASFFMTREGEVEWQYSLAMVDENDREQ
jgi:hypothetical protein